MERFQNESRFSSWAGLVPECKESAGKKMSTRIRKGNKYLMLIAIYHMLKEKVPYCELGADHYTIINQEKMIRRNLYSLEKLGVNIIIQPN